jgi:hypothetical protein
MRDHTEESLRIIRGGINDMNEALAWAVNILDTRFAGANMVRVELEQYLIISDDETDGKYQWTATVSGLVKEE